ncbi:hypothetical protein NECAME_01634 [Necator americanus]|uniref:Uncharacterized protein n=1 Tax=Necator americanus TaxID=51031 RepID=W2TRI7_NECAM|nr:hypothetical protein NECAME_01634 [Necator americanus]ETN84408.1 hypothetical protein NECAME_01634 [Necator americanus]
MTTTNDFNRWWKFHTHCRRPLVNFISSALSSGISLMESVSNVNGDRGETQLLAESMIECDIKRLKSDDVNIR